MEWGGKPVLRHLARIEIGKSRVQSLELIDVLEDSFHDLVDHVLGHVGRGDEGGTDAESRRVIVVAAIHAARDRRRAVIAVLLDQLVDGRSGHVDEDSVGVRRSPISACACSRCSAAPRTSSASCTRATWATSASPWKGRTP